MIVCLADAIPFLVFSLALKLRSKVHNFWSLRVAVLIKPFYLLDDFVVVFA